MGVQEPWNSERFVELVRDHVGPWLQRSFPDLNEMKILIDGEKAMHTPEANAALMKFGMSTLPSWPEYSPDLNPQENLWARAEVLLRQGERSGDSFETFKKRVLTACHAYRGAEKLIPSMAKRIKATIENAGAIADVSILNMIVSITIISAFHEHRPFYN